MSLIEQLQQILDNAVSSGEECGLQLAVYRHGKLFCSLCSGCTAPDRRKKVTEETLFPVFSVGKGVVTALMHILHEEELFDYDDPVTKFWPEYLASGKEMTKIRDVLTHRAGLYAFPPDTPLEETFQWEKAYALLGTMAPLDRIGGKHHYHAQTYGILTGRLAELVTGKKLSMLLKEKIYDVLGIDRIFFGLPEEQFSTLARLDGTRNPEAGLLQYDRDFVLRGLNPSSNGCANALSIAKLYAALLPEGLEGKCLLKQQTVENATILQRAPDDPVLPGEWAKFGLGWALCGPADNLGRMFGHGGACGSEGFADKETGLAVGFTKNRLNPNHPDHITRNRISEVLGIPARVW